MATRRFDVEVPDGQHLGFSRDTDGAYRAHLFDDGTNRLVGHAELFEADEDESQWSAAHRYGSPSDGSEARELTPEEIAEALEALATVVLVVASLAAAAAPRVRRWWTGTAVAARASGARVRSAVTSSRDQAVDALRSTWRKVGRARTRDDAGAYEVATAGGPRREAATSTELEVAFHDYRTRMSSTEAQERFVAALLAKAFSDEQMRLLRSVTIEDADGEVALGEVAQAPTPQQIAETVRSMLRQNPSLLDGDSLAALRDLLGRGGRDHEHLPSRVRRVVQPPPGPDGPGASTGTSQTQAERHVER